MRCISCSLMIPVTKIKKSVYLLISLVLLLCLVVILWYPHFNIYSNGNAVLLKKKKKKGNAVVLSIIRVGFISLAWNWSGCAIKATLLFIYEVLELSSILVIVMTDVYSNPQFVKCFFVFVFLLGIFRGRKRRRVMYFPTWKYAIKV